MAKTPKDIIKKDEPKEIERSETLDDDSNEDEEDDTNTIDNKTRGQYPIWRPEQNYQYKPINYDYEPNFVQV